MFQCSVYSFSGNLTFKEKRICYYFEKSFEKNEIAAAKTLLVQ